MDILSDLSILYMASLHTSTWVTTMKKQILIIRLLKAVWLGFSRAQDLTATKRTRSFLWQF